MREYDPDRRLASANKLRRGCAAFGVLKHVVVQLAHELPGGLLATHLEHRAERGVRCPRTRRVRHQHLALPFWLEQIIPRLRWLEARMLGQKLGIRREAKRADVDASPEIVGVFQ
jgi:hypothetical protein